MTSATLSVGGSGGFRHFQQRLGLEECATLQLGSPFDYRAQVELHRMILPAILILAFLTGSVLGSGLAILVPPRWTTPAE